MFQTGHRLEVTYTFLFTSTYTYGCAAADWWWDEWFDESGILGMWPWLSSCSLGAQQTISLDFSA